jgi:hypothetical protein
MTIHEKFIEDMEKSGFKTHFYKGRNFWKGPAVVTSIKNGIDLQRITRSTDVQLQSDHLGKEDLVVYPQALAGETYLETSLEEDHF